MSVGVVGGATQVHEPSRWSRPTLAAACTGALGALWVGFVNALLHSAGWIAGTQAPVLATSADRLRLAVPIVGLGVVVSWTLARSPLPSSLLRVAVLAAGGAQLVAVWLVLSRGVSDIEPVPDIAWYLTVMAGGVAGATLVGVAATRAGPGVGQGGLVACVGWAWLAVAGANGLSVTTCVAHSYLRQPHSYTGTAAVGIVLVVLGAVSIWRGTDAGSRSKWFWRGTAIAMVLASVGYTFALLQKPAEVIGGCTVMIS